MIDFEDACMDSPAGVALLAALEIRERTDVTWFERADDSLPAAVEAATRAVDTLTFGELCSVAVYAAQVVGPWTSGAPQTVAAAYRNAEARRPLAAAIDQRFNRELHAPMDSNHQQWWTSAGPHDTPFARRQLFQDFDAVYGNGEFTLAGLWTVTDPPAEAHDEFIDAWEISPGPISRRRLPVNMGARVYELHRPEDWNNLIRAHPFVATTTHGSWELPGPNQSLKSTGLLDIPHQKAAVTELTTHLLPDWQRVAKSFDAIHLSWAGFITMEGYVKSADEGTVTMLRSWGSERTHWLADCFKEPEPLSAPVLSGRISGGLGISSLADASRRAEDLEYLEHLLGR